MDNKSISQYQKDTDKKWTMQNYKSQYSLLSCTTIENLGPLGLKYNTIGKYHRLS